MQVDRLSTWVERQLKQENWVAVNGEEGCAQVGIQINFD